MANAWIGSIGYTNDQNLSWLHWLHQWSMLELALLTASMANVWIGSVDCINGQCVNWLYWLHTSMTNVWIGSIGYWLDDRLDDASWFAGGGLGGLGRHEGSCILEDLLLHKVRCDGWEILLGAKLALDVSVEVGSVQSKGNHH